MQGNDAAYESEVSSGAIVVREKRSSVNVIFGFLMVVFALALVRGHLGAETSAGRIAGDVIFTTVLTLTGVTWWYLRRHPARFEISPDAIVYAHRGLPRVQRFQGGPGELYVRFAGGKHPQPYLCYTGSEEAFLLNTFDRNEVLQACVAKGWSVASR